uniref:C2 domain-containing protein n=1 Tax=Ananas comosus var. bracteatus TaxID=296719 RepID=A0A6V7QG46_ANACO|nr:unnamed protein product [Ananas comosus var. bracteatus]
MANFSSSEPQEPTSPSSPSSSHSRETNGSAETDDSESAMATVAHLLEQLHASMSSPLEKELITARLLALARAKKETKVLIGSHSQAMPLFISVLRSGTVTAKVNVALTLSTLCKEEDLRVKVLLGGCIPPLLSLLKSESLNAKKAAAEAILKQDRVVEGFVTGALRNLCGEKDGYWRATIEAGGVEIITGLLSSNNTAAQSNAASLLARLISAFGDSIPKLIDTGAVKALLGLLGRDNDISVRASAADALEALSSKSTMAKKTVVDAEPCSSCLANMCSGMTSLILYLGELSQSSRLNAPVADILGALAYSLMVFDGDEEKVFDPVNIENILITLLKPRDIKLVQDRVLEALASLYGNPCLFSRLHHSAAKKVLIGLITMASADVQEHLILSLTSLCCDNVDIWDALGKREGIHLLISLLGLSSEQHQEYAVSLLAILTDQVDESKWAVTAAGGIPPLVQLLETGSQKAREDGAHVLWNLCRHSDDIRACVESAGAVPALLWLLKSGSPKGQEASAKALKKLIHFADSATINQLLALLLSDSLSSKSHVINVLGHVLMMASHKDLVQKGAPANKGLRSLAQALNSSNEETQECAASVLADLFSTREDICDSLATDEIVHPCMKLLTSKTQVVATQSARALGALSRPANAKSKNKVSYIGEGDVQPLIKMAKTSSIDAAETAIAALANLLSDPQIAGEALTEEIVLSLTRVLKEGTLEGKISSSRALHQLLNHFPLCEVLPEYSQCRFVVRALLDSLAEMDVEGVVYLGPLDVLALLASTKESVNFGFPPWSALAEDPESLQPLFRCLDVGLPIVQEKSIEILSRLCQEKHSLLGDFLVRREGCIVSLATRVIESSSIAVRIGGAALLICAVKENRVRPIDILDASGLLRKLIYCLIDMLKLHSTSSSPESEVRNPRNYMERNAFDDSDIHDPARILEGTIALWLLAIVSSSQVESKLIIMEAGGVEILSDRLARYTANSQAEFEGTEGIWPSALLLAILFQDSTVVQSSLITRTIPSLVFLLKSDDIIDRYFAAQVMASLVCVGNKGIQLAIANSELKLAQNPGQVIMENLFKLEEVRTGATARKSLPLLVDLLRPMPDRPGAPLIALHLLTHLAEGSETNKVVMAEAGAVDALTKYLSLSPQDSTETTITDLLWILYSNSELLHSEASLSTLNQLIAVLRMGSRNARLSAGRTLKELFNSENIRETEMARQAIQPLVDMLNSGNEKEQEAALGALIKLTDGNISKASALTDVEGNPIETLHKILSFSSSLALKRDAAQLCYVLFGNSSVRTAPIATECIQPLISLMTSDSSLVVEPSVCALERLLDDEHHADIAATYEVITLLVSFVSKMNHNLSEPSISALIKLGKDRPHCKLDMVKAGVIDNALNMILDAPVSLSSSIIELLRILTNNSSIAKSSAAAGMVEPLFLVLQRPDIPMWGQHSALEALVNILEKPQRYYNQKCRSSSRAARGIGILSLQQMAIKALESISMSWPKAVAEAGGIFELSKVIVQDDPQPSHALWESAALVLSNVMRSYSENYFEVSMVVLVKLLNSTAESTVNIALGALLVQERNSKSSAISMAEAGAIDALLELLRSRQCEEASARLLEALFNNGRVREMKVAKYAIAPLSQYLLDPQSRSPPAKFLVTLALGNLFQHDSLARSSDAVSACRALISLLEDQPTEEMTVVAICALQSLVMHSRTNRRAVAEAGGILVVQELLLSSNVEVSGQAALLIKYLFSNHTLQEYVSNELIRSLTAALEKELWSTAIINEEVLKTIYVIFTNFKKLRTSEAATLCIPHLVGALKSGNEPAQETVLDTLCLLKESWSQMNEDIAKAQALIAAEAIPILQMLMKTCPPSFHERADSLLHCLPGCLTVTIKRGNNLKQTMGSTNAFCCLKIGNGPPRQTKVVNHSTCPEWKEGFTWAFDVPPKGQKLYILCKSKNTFGKSTLGRVTIQIDKVVTEGIYSGFFSLSHDGRKDGSRTLEIEIVWSNRTSNDGI